MDDFGRLFMLSTQDQEVYSMLLSHKDENAQYERPMSQGSKNFFKIGKERNFTGRGSNRGAGRGYGRGTRSHFSNGDNNSAVSTGISGPYNMGNNPRTASNSGPSENGSSLRGFGKPNRRGAARLPYGRGTF